MNKFIHLLCFIIIVVSVFFLFFIYYKYRVNAIAPSLESKTEFVQNEKYFNLQIQGNKLLSNSNQFYLRGITSNYFRNRQNYPYFKDANELISTFNTVHNWGANTLQLYLNPTLFTQNKDGTNKYITELDQIIDWCQKNKVWVILNPVNDVIWVDKIPSRSKEALIKRDGITIFLSKMAKEYSGYSNIIFGIEAEPKFIDDPGVIIQRISQIQKHNKNPILFPLQNFSGILDIEELIKNNNFKNIILDIHPYPGRNLNYPAETEIKINKFINQNLLDNYPIIFGEFGGFWDDNFNTPEDILSLTKTGQMAIDNQISFMMYALDDDNMPMFNKDGGLNIRGAAFKNLLGQQK